jgi:hypothetical protein
VKKFFDSIEKFKAAGRHPKWQDINLAYEVPGWKRFGPAQEWLESRKAAEKSSSGGSGDELRVAFDEFLRENLGSGVKLSAEKQNALFSTFLQWRKRQESARR